VRGTGKQLSLWPPTLSHFSHLTTIDLSGNAITYIPQSAAALTKLQVPASQLLLRCAALCCDEATAHRANDWCMRCKQASQRPATLLSRYQTPIVAPLRLHTQC
jgi:hypothetical protein